MSNEDDFALIREFKDRTGQKPTPPPSVAPVRPPRPAAAKAAPKPSTAASRPKKGKKPVLGYMEWTAQEKAKKAARLARAENAQTYTEQDRVKHDAFGFGTVKEISSNGLVVVKFDTGEERRLMGNVAPMRIVT